MNTHVQGFQRFIKWLENDLDNFVSLVEEGSVAVGDPFQPGFSDHDLNVIVSKNKDQAVKDMSVYLTSNPLGNTYLVSPRLYSAFITGDTLNDLSLKFRSKSVAGSDVVSEKIPPSRSAILSAGEAGLIDLIPRFERRGLNIAQWDIDYARHKNYEFFKNFFVFTA